MIRWKYVGPRVALLALVGAAFWLALDPLVRRSIVSLGQVVTGARVELADVRASIFGARVHLSDLKVADPHHPMKNAFEFREAVLDLDSRSLLNRKCVVHQAAIRGLKFYTDRPTSGTIHKTPRPFALPVQLDGDRMSGLALQWLRQVGQTFRKDIQEELETVDLVRDLMKRWPSEYDQLRARAESLYGQVEELQRLIDSSTSGNDPLQRIKTFSRAASQLSEIQSHSGVLRSEVERLQQQLAEDRLQVSQSAEHDIRRVRELLQLDNLNGTTLSHYLLGPETTRLTAELLTWIQRGRRYLPKKVETPRPTRSQGTTYCFAESTPSPDFVIRSLILEGQGTVNGRPYEFYGRAEGLTSQPWLSRQPIRLVAKTRGVVDATVQVYLDNFRGSGRDRISIHCPRLEQPELTLGREDELALCIAPGTASVSAVLDVAAGELSGRLKFARDGLQMIPTLSEKLGGEILASRIQDAMRDVRRLDVVVSVSGTFEQPICSLQTDLGEQLAVGVNRVVRQEIEAFRDRMLEQTRERLDTELASLDRLLNDRRQQVLEKLHLGDNQIKELKLQVASRVQVPQPLLNENSPIGGLFR